MHLTASHGKLILLDWQDIKTQKLLNQANQHAVFIKPSQLDINQPDQAILLQTTEQLNEYFDGTRRNFSIPLDFSYGTQFQQQVWAALLTIDYGQTISYAKLATLIDKPKAFRACANANGKKSFKPNRSLSPSGLHLMGVWVVIQVVLPLKKSIIRF